MLEELGYAGLLRPIGQTLDHLSIDSFSVTTEDDGFIVRDKTRNRTQLTPRERTFLNELGAAHAASFQKRDALRMAIGVFEWHLTKEDIERLDVVARERRRETEQAPDSHSVSQILRMVGEMIDNRRGSLVSVSKVDDKVTVEFLSSSGQLISEDYTLAMIYNYWVRAYKKRSGGGS